MTEPQKNNDIPACGRRLRKTREELGLSVEDVADELHLSHFQIEALEADDWTRLPGTTYARGYLRSYARLLGLDAEQLLSGASTQEIEISRVEPGLPRKPPEQPAAAPAGEPARSRPGAEDADDPAAAAPGSRSNRGWIAGVVVVGVLALAVWQYGLPPQLASYIGDDETAPAAEPAGTATAAPAAEADDAAAATAQPAPVEPPVTPESMDVAAGSDAAAGDRPGMPTEPRFVVFDFEQRSWIDVRDARGERLLYRDFQPGRRIEIEGQPPFRVFLGNARGVQVEYLGEVVEPDTGTDRIYARFVLGASSG